MLAPSILASLLSSVQKFILCTCLFHLSFLAHCLFGSSNIARGSGGNPLLTRPLHSGYLKSSTFVLIYTRVQCYKYDTTTKTCQIVLSKKIARVPSLRYQSNHNSLSNTLNTFNVSVGSTVMLVMIDAVKLYLKG